MCSFFYKLEANKSQENRFRQLFNLDSCTIGYMDFIKLLHLYNSISQTIKKQEIKDTSIKVF